MSHPRRCRGRSIPLCPWDWRRVGAFADYLRLAARTVVSMLRTPCGQRFLTIAQEPDDVQAEAREAQRVLDGDLTGTPWSLPPSPPPTTTIMSWRARDGQRLWSRELAVPLSWRRFACPKVRATEMLAVIMHARGLVVLCVQSGRLLLDQELPNTLCCNRQRMHCSGNQIVLTAKRVVGGVGVEAWVCVVLSSSVADTTNVRQSWADARANLQRLPHVHHHYLETVPAYFCRGAGYLCQLFSDDYDQWRWLEVVDFDESR